MVSEHRLCRCGQGDNLILILVKHSWRRIAAQSSSDSPNLIVIEVICRCLRKSRSGVPGNSVVAAHVARDWNWVLAGRILHSSYIKKPCWVSISEFCFCERLKTTHSWVSSQVGSGSGQHWLETATKPILDFRSSPGQVPIRVMANVNIRRAANRRAAVPSRQPPSQSSNLTSFKGLDCFCNCKSSEVGIELYFLLRTRGDEIYMVTRVDHPLEADFQR